MAFIISLFVQQILMMPSSGLWPMLLAEITILCLTNPQKQLMMMFIPFTIPAKYYPWALFGFFTLINVSIQFDILAGILYGYLFFFYLKDKLEFSDEFINRAENWHLVNKLNSCESFVSLSKSISISGGNLFFSGSGTNANARAASQSTNNQIPNRPQVPISAPFKGVGTVLGCKRIKICLLKKI